MFPGMHPPTFVQNASFSQLSHVVLNEWLVCADNRARISLFNELAAECSPKLFIIVRICRDDREFSVLRNHLRHDPINRPSNSIQAAIS